MSRQPQSRYLHAAVGVGQRLYVWGGKSISSMQTTTIESFDVSLEMWEKPQQLQDPLLPDGLYGMAVVSSGKNAYSFAGRTRSRSYFNTLYQIDLATLKCRELVQASSSQAPKKTCGSAMVHFKDMLVVHGGYTGEERVDELHVFDLRTSEFVVASII